MFFSHPLDATYRIWYDLYRIKYFARPALPVRDNCPKIPFIADCRLAAFCTGAPQGIFAQDPRLTAFGPIIFTRIL